MKRVSAMGEGGGSNVLPVLPVEQFQRMEMK